MSLFPLHTLLLTYFTYWFLFFFFYLEFNPSQHLFVQPGQRLVKNVQFRSLSRVGQRRKLFHKLDRKRISLSHLQKHLLLAQEGNFFVCSVFFMHSESECSKKKIRRSWKVLWLHRIEERYATWSILILLEDKGETSSVIWPTWKWLRKGKIVILWFLFALHNLLLTYFSYLLLVFFFPFRV